MGQTKFLRWAEANLSEAQTYMSAANDYSQSHWDEQFCAEWYPRLCVDGLYVVPFFGPPAEGAGGLIEEPDQFAALRVNAEIVDMVYWPDDE